MQQLPLKLGCVGVFLLFLFFLETPVVAQHRASTDRPREYKTGGQSTARKQTSIPASCDKVFNQIEHSIVGGSDFGALDRFFGGQVYMSVRGAGDGYYSGTQAFSILEDFFQTHRTLTFRFSTMDSNAPTPYATGGGNFMRHGVIETYQIYVALAKSDARWVISQFNIY